MPRRQRQRHYTAPGQPPPSLPYVPVGQPAWPLDPFGYGGMPPPYYGMPAGAMGPYGPGLYPRYLPLTGPAGGPAGGPAAPPMGPFGAQAWPGLPPAGQAPAGQGTAPGGAYGANPYGAAATGSVAWGQMTPGGAPAPGPAAGGRAQATQQGGPGRGQSAWKTSPAPPGINQGWWDEFTEKHGGQNPIEFYGQEETPWGTTQGLAEALGDLEWSQGFERMMGRPPTDDDWRAWWFQKFGMHEPGTEPTREQIARQRKRAKKQARQQQQAGQRYPSGGTGSSQQRAPTYMPPQIIWR